jgi:hypothetical protein
MGVAWERHGMCKLAFTGLLASLGQFRCLPLTVSPVKSLCVQPLLPVTNAYLDVRLEFQFRTNGFDPPVTETSNRGAL